jgi:hypothetical protein
MLDEQAVALCELTNPVANSRPLAEAQRLDLALFVVFEEWSVEVALTLLTQTADSRTLSFLTRQAEDDTRHLAAFRERLDRTLAARPSRADATQALLLRVLQNGRGTTAALRREEVVAAVIVPPLRRFLDRVRTAAAAGDVAESLVLLDLVFKGMASPLSAFEARFWEPVDPLLASLIRDTDEDERRHVSDAARIVRTLSNGEAARLARKCAEARAELTDAFRYYARKLVALYAVAKPQVASGELLTILLSAAEAGCTEALHQAGLDAHG